MKEWYFQINVKVSLLSLMLFFNTYYSSVTQGSVFYKTSTYIKSLTGF